MPLTVFGQKEKLTFGLNSGINISIFDANYLQTNSFLGYSIGAKARLNLESVWGMKNMNSANWYIESGVNYIYNGYDYTFDNQSFIHPQKQIEIPFYLIGRASKKRLPRKMTKKNISLVGKFGTILSFQRYNNSNKTYSTENWIINDQIKQNWFNIYLAGGIGFERELNKIIIGTGITLHNGFLSSSSGTLTDYSKGKNWNYKYRGNYLSLDIFIILKDFKGLRKEKKSTDECGRPSF